jgi:tRNA(Ile)-lysidine synthase
MAPGRPADPVRDALTRWLTRYASAGPVTVACSGGPDSSALALATAAIGRAGRSITVDHGLQPDSAALAHRHADWLGSLGFDPVVVGVEVSGPGGPEAAARRVRYAALAAHARGPVLLGHTLDDQAETVLLGLGRGSGPRSIAGMRPWTPPWGRPLLSVRRVQTEQACRAAGREPWVDPHNSDPAFTRARLRAEVLPLLEDVLGGGVAPALARTAELMADDLAALDALADDALTDAADGAQLVARVLRGRPGAVRRRALRRWAASIGAESLTSEHLRRLDELVTLGRDGSGVRLPGAVDAVLRGGRLVAEQVADGRVEHG